MSDASTALHEENVYLALCSCMFMKISECGVLYLKISLCTSIDLCVSLNVHFEHRRLSVAGVAFVSDIFFFFVDSSNVHSCLLECPVVDGSVGDLQ